MIGADVGFGVAARGPANHRTAMCAAVYPRR
jgi:hypothetical protein